MPTLESMYFDELEALIERANLSIADCSHDEDLLRQRARKAQVILDEQARAAPPPSRRTIAGYECIVKRTRVCNDGADLAIVALHGFDATFAELEDLPQQLFEQDAALRGRSLLFVFPQAPTTPVGAAWWGYDSNRFRDGVTMDKRAIESFVHEEPAGLAECRERMGRLIAEVRRMAGGIPSARVLLVGYSHGAPTAMDIALQRDPAEAVAGVAFLSGVPIAVEQWKKRLRVHPRLRALLTHGAMDMSLPIAAGGYVRDLLSSAGADVSFVPHNGGHELGGRPVHAALADLTNELIARGTATTRHERESAPR